MSGRDWGPGHWQRKGPGRWSAEPRPQRQADSPKRPQRQAERHWRPVQASTVVQMASGLELVIANRNQAFG